MYRITLTNRLRILNTRSRLRRSRLFDIRIMWFLRSLQRPFESLRFEEIIPFTRNILKIIVRKVNRIVPYLIKETAILTLPGINLLETHVICVEIVIVVISSRDWIFTEISNPITKS